MSPMSNATGTFKTPEEIAATRAAPRNYCGECGDYHAAGRHNPEYAVWLEDDDPAVDTHLVRATSPSDAAETWAERTDAHDPGPGSVISGTSATVCVRAPDGTVTRWVVSGEAVPRYEAAQVPDGVAAPATAQPTVPNTEGAPCTDEPNARVLW